MTSPDYSLTQTEVIRPFLATLLPEQGRIYECTFQPSIKIVSTYDKITGVLIEYPCEQITLTATLHRTKSICDLLTLRISNVDERRTAPSFYKKVERYLTLQLCEPLVREPERADEIIIALLL